MAVDFHYDRYFAPTVHFNGEDQFTVNMTAILRTKIIVMRVSKRYLFDPSDQIGRYQEQQWPKNLYLYFLNGH